MIPIKSNLLLLLDFLLLGSLVMLAFYYSSPSLLTAGLIITVIITVFIKHRTPVIVFYMLVLAFLLSTIFFSELRPADPATYSIQLLLLSATIFIVMYLGNRNRVIQQANTHHESLYQNATEGIILTNNRGEIVLVNPAAEAMFGYREEELQGKPIEVLIPMRHRAAHVGMRDGFYNSPQNRVMGHGRDLNGARKNGDEFPVEVSLSHYKQNESSFVIAFVVDITKRKNIEANLLLQKKELEKASEAVRKLNTQLEAKVEERTIILTEALQKLEQSQRELSEALDKEKQLNEIKGRFVSMASHEFRTPLSTVLSSAALLSKYQESGEQLKREKHINRIRDSVKQLNNILEDFLSLGKLEEGKISLQIKEFSIHSLYAEIREEMMAHLKKDQQVIFNHQGNSQILTDRILIKNILFNLVGNAIKFSGENSLVEISSHNFQDSLFLQVRDEGIGIPEEDQPNLFSSFFRAGNAVNIEGTGLGLHIVKRYLDLLNGEISVKSAPGLGTTIEINIPLNSTSHDHHPSDR